MTSTDTAGTIDTGAANLYRIAFGLVGLLTAVLGVLILVWPGKTAAVVTAIIAIYAVLAGIVYVALGIFSSAKSGWSRIGHIVLGVLFVIAGIVSFSNLAATTATLAWIVAIFIGVTWLIEGFVALFTINQSPASKGWTIFSSLLSVVAGAFVLTSPLWAAVTLWLFLGIALIVLGLVQIGRAISFGKAVKVA